MKIGKNRLNSAISRPILIVGIVVIIMFAAFLGLTYQGTQTPDTTTSVSTTTTTTSTTVTSSTSQQSLTLNGAGATFPYPLLSTMGFEYNKLQPNIKLNYQSIGSGGGVKQHTAMTVDFGASDATLTKTQADAAQNTLHIPITIGSVVFAYNLPGIQKGLKVTGPVIADVFLGKITRWNDPAIKNLNPEIQLPDKDILVVHRSDGSGTSFVWTSYLSIISSEWNSKVGSGTAVQWPIGLGSAGNEGVAGLIRGTAYTAGYVELAYAIQNTMSYGYIQNIASQFIEPTLNSTKAAAEAASISLPLGNQSWTSVSILNAPGVASYPIASFSYLLVYKELSILSSMDKTRAKALVDFLWWAVHDGQSLAPNLQYVPLPKSVVAIDEASINSITFKGEPLKN